LIVLLLQRWVYGMIFSERGMKGKFRRFEDEREEEGSKGTEESGKGGRERGKMTGKTDEV
jgi:hypothetical protein